MAGLSGKSTKLSGKKFPTDSEALDFFGRQLQLGHFVGCPGGLPLSSGLFRRQSISRSNPKQQHPTRLRAPKCRERVLARRVAKGILFLIEQQFGAEDVGGSRIVAFCTLAALLDLTMAAAKVATLQGATGTLAGASQSKLLERKIHAAPLNLRRSLFVPSFQAKSNGMGISKQAQRGRGVRAALAERSVTQYVSSITFVTSDLRGTDSCCLSSLDAICLVI